MIQLLSQGAIVRCFFVTRHDIAAPGTSFRDGCSRKAWCPVRGIRIALPDAIDTRLTLRISRTGHQPNAANPRPRQYNLVHP